MQNARALAKDQADFEEAKANPDRITGLAIMMRLSLNAASAVLRDWAAKWLLENYNVRVVRPVEGPTHATPAPSNDIC